MADQRCVTCLLPTAYLMSLIDSGHPTGTGDPACLFLLCVTILLYHVQEVYDTYSTIYDDVPTVT